MEPESSDRVEDADAVRGLGPTRARVLTLLQEAGAALSAAEVAGRLGLHPNTARFHLEALTGRGFTGRTREQLDAAAPGRPRVLYAARGAGRGPRRYEALAGVLAGFLAGRLDDPAAESEAAGREWGRFLAPRPAPFSRTDEEEALELLERSMDDVGFDSRVVPTPGDGVRVEIHHCPFLEVARDRQEVVCALHLGLMRGLLEGSGGPLVAESLEPLVEPGLCRAHLARRAPT